MIWCGKTLQCLLAFSSCNRTNKCAETHQSHIITHPQWWAPKTFVGHLTWLHTVKLDAQVWQGLKLLIFVLAAFRWQQFCDHASA